jgi:hypothetical protein
VGNGVGAEVEDDRHVGVAQPFADDRELKTDPIIDCGLSL